MFEALTALFLRIISNPCANFFQKKLASFESSFAVNLYSSFFMFLFCLPFFFLFNIFSFDFNFYFLVFLSGLFCFLGTISLIKALSIGEMSVLGPINSYKSVLGLIFAFFLLGELPSLKAFLGFILILCASFFFIDENGKFILNKSVCLRLLALVFTGIEAVILKKIILLSNPIVCLTFWCLTGFLFSFVFAFFSGKTKMKNKSSYFYCFLIAVLLFLMQFSTNFVFKYFEVGLSLSLFQLSSIVSLFLGFKFFKEKGILRKTFGTIIMITGSFLILLK